MFFFHKSILKIFNIDNEHNIYIKFNIKRKSLNIDVEIVFAIHILYYSKIIKVILCQEIKLNVINDIYYNNDKVWCMYKTKDETTKSKTKLKRLYKREMKFVNFLAKETNSHVTRLSFEFVMSNLTKSNKNRLIWHHDNNFSLEDWTFAKRWRRDNERRKTKDERRWYEER